MGCRRTRPAAELVRLARRADGSLAWGRTLPGRGAWLCAGPAGAPCFDEARRRRAFARAFRSPVQVDDQDVQALRDQQYAPGS